MTIIVGAVCKNIEKSIPLFQQFLQILLAAFPTTQVCIYENNSTDGTKEGLNTLKSALGANVHITMEDFTNEELLARCKANTWDMKPCRMEVIAMARNQLLDMIERIGYSGNDLIVMIDCDILYLPDMEALKDRLEHFPPNVDAVFANGIYAGSNRYYDRYALRTVTFPLGPEVRGEEFWRNLPNIVISEPTQIISGFGGLAIYKGYCIRNNRYSAIPTKELHKLNSDLIKMLNITLPKPSDPCRDGCLLGMYLFGDDIFYYNNSGYNYPVVCEHSTFNANMLLRGQGRFVIDAGLKYYV